MRVPYASVARSETWYVSFTITTCLTVLRLSAVLHSGGPQANSPRTLAIDHNTDVLPVGPVTTRIMKLLSVNPGSYPDAPREAIRRFLEEVTGDPYPIDKKIDSSRIESVRMGTTVATNALLERKGERTTFVTTEGLKDILIIGNQSRPQIFDLRIERPEPIVESVIEASERVRVVSRTAVTETTGGIEAASDGLKGSTESASTTASSTPDSIFLGEQVKTAVGVTGETVQILKPLDEEQLRTHLRAQRAKGINAVAVALAHSYTFREHEQRIAEIAREEGFTQVSLSSEVMPAVKLVPRAFTACADAYLTPCINRYLSQFLSGFDDQFLDRCQLLFMQSDGGLTSVSSFTGFRAVLSGPAGGVVGFSRTSFVDPKLVKNGHGEKASSKLLEQSEDDMDDADDDEDELVDAFRADVNENSDFERKMALLKTDPKCTGSLIPGQPVIGFDMGGTSTDVSRYDGSLDHIFENTTAGVTIQAPQLDINTVAAGGGSILTFTAGLFNVGPESASANPGPACYRNNGPATVTDANVVLGRIQPKHFPHVFGREQNLPLDADASRAVFAALADKINAWQQAQAAERGVSSAHSMTIEDVALGFVAVANEAMCRPIRALTEARGFDVTKHVLACFGAAGGQHACAIAESLGISRVHVHPFSGVLSAYGMGLADVVVERQSPFSMYLTKSSSDTDSSREVGIEALASVVARTVELVQGTAADLEHQGFQHANIRHELYLGLRYEGTDTSIMVHAPQSILQLANSRASSSSVPSEDTPVLSDLVAKLQRLFIKRYKREFGFVLARPIIIDTVRIRSIGSASSLLISETEWAEQSLSAGSASLPAPVDVVKVYFSAKGQQGGDQAFNEPGQPFEGKMDGPSHGRPRGAWVDTPIYHLRDLPIHCRADGPCTIIDTTCTVVVDPEWSAYILPDHSISIIKSGKTTKVDDELTQHEETVERQDAPLPSLEETVSRYPCDPIQLSIFSHRFMSVAEQMGRALQRTAVSTNIKERLDFSCALFGPDGGLVANAPHLPVHLGAMQEAVKAQIRILGKDIHDGDVLVSNHPQAGGSHLPDITVITPVFAPSKSPYAKYNARGPLFFLASRGHHADIGGISPGSMPPFSKYLYQEGAAIESFKLVRRGGEFDVEGISALLKAPANFPRRHPDEPACAGTRNLEDNLSDLRAQVAANQKGVLLMRSLIETYTLPFVQAYMYHIQRAAEDAVREMLVEYSLKAGLPEVATLPPVEDFMDDGSPIRLSVTIDRRNGGTAVFDFTGTASQVHGNTNAPKAVTYSAIIYCLRCMVRRTIPLNQGCLNPVQVVIPENSLLNPSADAAVVGGNVLTSQRVTDVVLKAFNAAAASQGCMNNLTFGDERFGYYETIAGGAGAGPGWNGSSGVHTHMTNTRITDVEVIERRYPVLIRQFKIRENSGGAGRFRGGDGVIREIQFLKPLTVNILSERRICRPWGLHGGGEAARGENYILKYGGGYSTNNKPLKISLGGKNTYYADAGDAILILTPGGGGYGVPPGQPQEQQHLLSVMDSVDDENAVRTTHPTFGSVANYIQAQESV